MTPKYRDLDLQLDGSLALILLARPDKRNAINDGLVQALRDLFQQLPPSARTARLYREGEHM